MHGCYRRKKIFACSWSRTRGHSKENILRKKQQAVRRHFLTQVSKYLKDNKHNSLYFARIFVLGHSWSVRSPSMKNICSSLVTGNLEQKNNNNNFWFLITHFVFSFPFPIPAFSNIGVCLIFKMADFAAKRSSWCHTVSFLENGSYRGEGNWMKTELNGPKLAHETHTM